jgi:hypothetical protein
MSDEETQKKLSQLVKRAWGDEKLKERLLNDPTPLLRENGIELPAGVEARVVADKDSVSFQFQPDKPAGDGAELTENALTSVVGGTAGRTFLKFTFSTVFTT